MIDAGSEETVGPYILHREIARGGMATIHVARLIGDEGFSRIVAAKRMLPELAADADFVSMFIDEAKIASRVQHRNVVPVLDVVASGGEVILVQEYVHGVPLNTLLKNAAMAGERVPVDIAVSIASQILLGLQAAHDTLGPRGKPLDIVHRDVSPGNIMVGVDGTARLLDFGVAKAAFAAHITRAGTFKGKRTYSAPEALRGQATRQSDVYSLSVVLWELLVGRRMHSKQDPEDAMIEKIMQGGLPTVTEVLADDRARIDDARWLQLRAVEPIVMQGLAKQPAERWATAAEMEKALVPAVRPASSAEVSSWVKRTGREFLDGREQVLASEEAGWRSRPPSARFARASREIERMGTPKEVEQLAPEEGASGLGPRASAREVESVVWWRRVDPTISILCGLVLLLALVIIVVAKRSGRDTVIVPVPAAAPAATAPPPPPSVPVTVKPEVQSPRSEAQKPATTKAPAKVQRSAPAAAHVVAKPTPPPPPLPPEPASRRSAPNCNPPYYFKGSKKIFKPACL